MLGRLLFGSAAAIAFSAVAAHADGGYAPGAPIGVAALRPGRASTWAAMPVRRGLTCR
jgi:hypothetical protein